ncbi:MAG: hypothetical protein J0M12_07395, partial [Deltaproteobacteria bacterium]|nr:hypothetical protein [Deltaproteobacteria bacterium]
MIQAQTIYFWLVVTNLMALALLCWAGRNLPPSAGKRAFLLFIPCYLCWSNPLLVVQVLDLHGPYIRLMSQIIYAGGIVFMAALGYFILTIAAPAALNSIPFWLFQLNYAVLFVLSFLGFIEGGIERMPDGTLQPLEGPLFRYFNWSMLPFGLYFLSMCGISY